MVAIFQWKKSGFYSSPINLEGGKGFCRGDIDNDGVVEKFDRVLPHTPVDNESIQCSTGGDNLTAD